MAHQIVEQLGFYLGTVIGGFMVGAICGLMPLIAGLYRGRRHTAAITWLLCVLTAILGSLIPSTPEVSFLISLPLAFLLMIIILCGRPASGYSSCEQSQGGAFKGVLLTGCVLASVAGGTIGILHNQVDRREGERHMQDTAKVLTADNTEVSRQSTKRTESPATQSRSSARSPLAPIQWAHPPDKMDSTLAETANHRYGLTPHGGIVLYYKHPDGVEEFLGWLANEGLRVEPTRIKNVEKAVRRHQAAVALSSQKESESLSGFEEQFISSTTVSSHVLNGGCLYAYSLGRKGAYAEVEDVCYTLDTLREGEYVSGRTIVGMDKFEWSYAMRFFTSEWKIIEIGCAQITAEKDGKKWAYIAGQKGWEVLKVD